MIIFTHVAVGFEQVTPNNNQIKSKHKGKAFHAFKLTCVVQSGGDAGNGPVRAELGHAVVSLNDERVVQMRIQVANDDRAVLQVRGARLEADVLAAGDT